MYKTENTSLKDIDIVFELYNYARKYQKIKKAVIWPNFDRKAIEKDITDKRQWKITIDNEMACVWTIEHNDPIIWGERDKTPSIYIHKIATNPMFRGHGMVSKIIDWSTMYARTFGKSFIRMDTCGDNQELIAYYKKCGFNHIDSFLLKKHETLPSHYHNNIVQLFEIEL